MSTPSNRRLWPRDGPRDTSSVAEVKVYEALAKYLPEGWQAWHSMRLRGNTKGEFSETDFVIAAPSRPSILILEVKGGSIEQVGGRWYQNGRPMKLSPLDQAFSFRKLLIQRFKENKIQLPTTGVAACFPDTFFSQQPKQDDLRGLVIGGQDLPYLDKILPDVMTRAVPNPRTVTGQWLKLLHELWGETWVPELRLGQRARLEEGRRIVLDEDQFRRLEEIEENDRVIITGPAGTGKTLLAREAALRQARQGKRVLLLCFTHALGNWLAKSVNDPNVTTRAIRIFATELLGEPVPGDPASMPSEFWENVSLKAAIEALPSQADLWDCIIVDEAQDLSEDDWELIRECMKEGGRLWVFADDGQRFWEDRQIPKEIMDASFKLKLRRPYRCPVEIQNLAESYLDLAAQDSDLIKRGVRDGTIRILPCSQQTLVKRVGSEINRLVSSGLKASEIAVISVRGRRAKNSIIHYNELGGHSVVPATSDMAECGIICDTFLRFKGLERPGIIITDLRLVSNNYERRMYIAVSRALATLSIVASKETIEQDQRLSRIMA